MQQITVKDVQSKSGEKNGKAWTKYTVIDMNGGSYGTFSSDATGIHPGDVMDIEVNVNGKYTDLKNWKFLSRANGTTPPAIPQAPPAAIKPQAGTPQPDDRRDSIETHAVKVVAELWAAGKLTDNEPLVLRACQWLSDKLPTLRELKPQVKKADADDIPF